jgi:Uncharacterized protein conserved in bacteria (DUF2188)
MAGSKRIVGPRSNSKGWQNVNPDDGSKTYHRTQENAAREATHQLKGSGGGERIIQGRDGQIRAKDTIPPKKDPRSTKG